MQQPPFRIPSAAGLGRTHGNGIFDEMKFRSIRRLQSAPALRAMLPDCRKARLGASNNSLLAARGIPSAEVELPAPPAPKNLAEKNVWADLALVAGEAATAWAVRSAPEMENDSGWIFLSTEAKFENLKGLC